MKVAKYQVRKLIETFNELQKREFRNLKLKLNITGYLLIIVTLPLIFTYNDNVLMYIFPLFIGLFVWLMISVMRFNTFIKAVYRENKEKGLVNF